jgi:nitrate reductase NapE component
MMTEQRSARLRPIARLSASQDRRSVASDHAGRLIQIALALYLIPALVVVLAVGGVGMMVLMVGRLVTGPIREPLG